MTIRITQILNNGRVAALAILAASIVGWGCVIAIPIASVPQTKAKRAYRPAAKKGDAVAQLQLAQAYRFGTAGVSKDPAQAWNWLNKSAESGLPEARLMLADALISGSWGQPVNVDAGLDILRAMAQNGRRDVQEHLAMMLLTLPGDSHAAEAAQWFEKSARAGNKHAAMKLGRLYNSGFGVAHDNVLAYAWFSIANDGVSLGILEPKLSKDELNRARQKIAQLRGEIAQ